MIKEPQRIKGPNLFFYILSLIFTASIMAAIIVLIIFVVDVVSKPFSEILPTVSFESLNRDLLKLIKLH